MAQLPDNGQWSQTQKNGPPRKCPKNPYAPTCECWRERTLELNISKPEADQHRAIERRAGNRLSTRDVGPHDSNLYKGGTRDPDIDTGNTMLPLQYARWGM